MQEILFSSFLVASLMKVSLVAVQFSVPSSQDVYSRLCLKNAKSMCWFQTTMLAGPTERIPLWVSKSFVGNGTTILVFPSVVDPSPSAQEARVYAQNQ